VCHKTDLLSWQKKMIFFMHKCWDKFLEPARLKWMTNSCVFLLLSIMKLNNHHSIRTILILNLTEKIKSYDMSLYLYNWCIQTGKELESHLLYLICTHNLFLTLSVKKLCSIIKHLTWLDNNLQLITYFTNYCLDFFFWTTKKFTCVGITVWISLYSNYLFRWSWVSGTRIIFIIISYHAWIC
jgi:hypothetical protein